MEPKKFVVRQSPSFNAAAIIGTTFAGLFFLFGAPFVAPFTWFVVRLLGWDINIFIHWIIDTILVWIIVTTLIWAIGRHKERPYRSN